MFFVKPVNISSVNRFRSYVIAALVSFWLCVFTFFLAPIWLCVVLFLAHLASLCLAVSDGYTLLAFLLVSKDQAGEGEAVPHVK